MVKHSRRYNTVAERVEVGHDYQPREAIELVKEVSTAKFDETVEIHLRTNSDPRHADQMVRGVTVLPHGLGKAVRVLVFASADAADIARQAGADYVGEDELIEQIEGGWMEFDVGLATPQVMPKIGRLGRILGRSGLMPNPRSGTMVQPRICPGPSRKRRQGAWSTGPIGPPSFTAPSEKYVFDTDQLLENLASLVGAILKDKPTALKGPFLRSAYLTSSMGPSIALDLAGLQAPGATGITRI